MPGGVDFGSHHFAIFLDNGDDGPGTGPPVDAGGCANVGSQTVSPILAFVQRTRQHTRFPRGVGIALRPGQRLLLNSHFLNDSDEPLVVDVAVNFRAARRGAIAHHVRTFELGTLDIAVPPYSEGSVSPSWTTPFAMNLVLLTSHSHKHTESAE